MSWNMYKNELLKTIKWWYYAKYLYLIRLNQTIIECNHKIDLSQHYVNSHQIKHAQYLTVYPHALQTESRDKDDTNYI